MSHSSYIITLCVAIFATVRAHELDVDVQCTRSGYSGACEEELSGGKYMNRCSNLRCAQRDEDGFYISIGIGRALNGTYCGPNWKCLDGQCEKPTTRKIPYGFDARFVCSVMPNQPTLDDQDPLLPVPPQQAGNAVNRQSSRPVRNQLDVDVQCQDARYSGACVEELSGGKYRNRCSNLMCAQRDEDGYYISIGIGRAVDGTYCGPNWKCLDGQCEKPTTRKIPYGFDARFVCSVMPNQPTLDDQDPLLPVPPQQAGNAVNRQSSRPVRNQLDVDVQCQDARYSGACVEELSGGKYRNRCSNLMCAQRDEDGRYISIGIGRAVDGTYCGPNWKCLDGQCEKPTTRKIPYGFDARYVCSVMPNQPTLGDQDPLLPVPPQQAGNAVKRKSSRPVRNQLDVDVQCRDAEYSGACVEKLSGGKYQNRCGDLRCAQRDQDGTYRAVGIGRARDGTYCGPKRKCDKGLCKKTSGRITRHGIDAKFVCSGMSGDIRPNWRHRFPPHEADEVEANRNFRAGPSRWGN